MAASVLRSTSSTARYLGMTRAGVGLLLVDIQNDFIDGSLAVPDAASIIPYVEALISQNDFDTIVLSQDYHPAGHVSFASSHRDAHDAPVQPFTPLRLPHPIRQRAQKGETIEQMMWPDHCIENSRGAEIHPGIWQAVQESHRAKQTPVHVVQKGTKMHIDGYSAFSDNQYLSFSRLPRLLLDGAAHTKSQKPIDTLVVVGLALDYCVLSSAVDAAKFNFNTIVPLAGVRGVAKDSSESAVEELRGWGVKVVETDEDLHRELQQYSGDRARSLRW